MKKFCFSLICLVVLLFVGFSTYYIVRNNESIAYTVSNNDTIYMNVGETIQSPIIHENKASSTKINVSLSNANVIFDEVNNTFHASKTGSTTITAVPSNANFSSISFTIRVGDGSVINPYYIRNEDDLRKIGKDDWRLTSSYELVSDIVLTQPFESIGDENSAFLGNLFGGETMYSISNIKIKSTSKTAGFFGSIGSSGRIERVRFEDISIAGNYAYAGAIAGINQGFIGQCYVGKADIKNSNTNSMTGALVGLNRSQGASAQISLCSVKANIVADGLVGGFVGKSEGGVVDNSIADIDVTLSKTSSVYGGVTASNTYSSLNLDGMAKYFNSRYVNVVSVLNRIGGIGKYYSVVGSSEIISSQPTTFTYYDMVMTCASNTIPVQGDVGQDNALSASATSSVNYYANLKPEELSSDSSFLDKAGSTWDFDSFWSVEGDIVLFISYEACAGSYPELPATSSVKAQINDEGELKNALALMRKFPSVNLEYTIPADASISLDYQGQALEPIGSKASPFFGKLVAEDGAYVEISNYTITDDEYSGFFGVIQGAETIIKNINFSGSYSGKVIGGVAGLNNGARIQNCDIESFNFDVKGVAGGLVGENHGTITGGGVNINSGYCEIFVNDIVLNEANVGLVAGVNAGDISSLQILALTIEVFTESDKPANFGGFVGKQTSGSISGCEVFSFALKATKLKGGIYAGGFVGYMEQGTIQNCSIANGLSIELPSTREGVYAGGIAGFVGNNAGIELCVVYEGTVVGYSGGGIAGVQHGRIERCAVMRGVNIEGYNVAGLVGDCAGTLRNSYSLATLIGSNLEAGFVTFLNEGASVKYCYNYCAYNGEGTGYCETSTAFRSNKANREFVNNVVVGEKVGGGGAVIEAIAGDTFVTKVKQRPLGQGYAKEVQIQTYGLSKGSFKLVNESIITGVGAFAEFTNSGFNSYIWNFSTEVASSEKELFASVVNEFNSQISSKAYIQVPALPEGGEVVGDGEGEGEGEPQKVDPTSVALGKIASSTDTSITTYFGLRDLPSEPNLAYTFKLNLSIENFINNELSHALEEGNELGKLLGIENEEGLNQVRETIKAGIRPIIEESLKNAVAKFAETKFVNEYGEIEYNIIYSGDGLSVNIEVTIPEMVQE